MQTNSDRPSKNKYAGPLSKKSKFTKAEDLQLIELIEKYSTKNWMKIARHLPPRTARQCRDRWFNYLDPDLSREPWTPTEDRILLKLQEKIGNHWKKMTEYLPRRSKNNIKQRWLFLKDVLEIKNDRVQKQTVVNTQPVASNNPIVLAPSNFYIAPSNISQVPSQEIIIPTIQHAAILPVTPVYLTISTPIIKIADDFQKNYQESLDFQNLNEIQPAYQNEFYNIMNENHY